MAVREAIYASFPEEKAKLIEKYIGDMPPQEAYQIIGHLYYTKDPKKTAEILKDPKTGFDSLVYDDIRSTLAMRKPNIEVKDDGKFCPTCKTRKSFARLEQRRAADEGMTAVYYCVVCRKDI